MVRHTERERIRHGPAHLSIRSALPSKPVTSHPSASSRWTSQPPPHPTSRIFLACVSRTASSTARFVPSRRLAMQISRTARVHSPALSSQLSRICRVRSESLTEPHPLGPYFLDLEAFLRRPPFLPPFFSRSSSSFSACSSVTSSGAMFLGSDAFVFWCFTYGP